MPVVALVSQKGGSGKSTLSTNIAVCAGRAGLKPVLVDLDPQGTASAWHTVRSTADIELQVANTATLTRTIDRLRRNGCFVVIDTPPHNAAAAAGVVSASDLVIVPARPAAFDLAAVAASASLIQSGRCRIARAVINAYLPSSDITDTTTFLENAGLPVLATIGQRIAFQHAAAVGGGVIEAEPATSKARIEIEQLWSAIVDLTKGA